MKKDLTSGSVFSTVVRFSLPYLLSYFLQTLYGLADLYIIGLFNEKEATAAVSIGSQVMHMLTVIIVGLAMGSTVLIGRAVGAKDFDNASKSVGNTISVFTIFSITLTGILLLSLNGIINIMSTPTEAIEGTRSYLLICIIGIPFITAYNVISSVFRGIGDTKSPMYFIAAACVFNILLDYIFIGKFGMGAAGAALGTTLAQVISVIISLIAIKAKNLIPWFKKGDIKPLKNFISAIMKIGLPIAAQDGFIQVSFLVITIIVNRRGLDDATAVGVVEKLICILFLVPSTMLSTVSALGAINIGAEKNDRAAKVLGYGILTVIIYGLIAAITMQFKAESAVALFNDDSNVILLGGQYMRSYVWDCIIAGIHFCFSGYFCAFGLSNISFIHNLISIICARIPLAIFFSSHFPTNLYPMGFSAPIGSALSIFICLIALIWMKKNPDKVNKKLIKE